MERWRVGGGAPGQVFVGAGTVGEQIRHAEFGGQRERGGDDGSLAQEGDLEWRR